MEILHIDHNDLPDGYSLVPNSEVAASLSDAFREEQILKLTELLTPE